MFFYGLEYIYSQNNEDDIVRAIAAHSPNCKSRASFDIDPLRSKMRIQFEALGLIQSVIREDTLSAQSIIGNTTMRSITWAITEFGRRYAAHVLSIKR